MGSVLKFEFSPEGRISMNRGEHGQRVSDSPRKKKGQGMERKKGMKKRPRQGDVLVEDVRKQSLLINLECQRPKESPDAGRTEMERGWGGLPPRKGGRRVSAMHEDYTHNAKKICRQTSWKESRMTTSFTGAKKLQKNQLH